MGSDKYTEILKRYWGYDSFRGIQREIIESISSGHDTLGLMPTGGGKSITFQVPAMAMQGTCIVVTPLIALMKDQVDNLRRRGIRAAAIYSGLSHEEIIITLENCILGNTKLLYVSPERIGSELFQTKLRHMRVSFITVDEAHCISQWGYDFRPSYLEIAQIRKLLPGKPVLALTATATPKVVEDICQKLHLDNRSQTADDSRHHRFRFFRMSFERKNLAYVVRHAPDKREQLLHILSRQQGSAIVYARSRKRTKEFAQMLTEAGITASFYHAGLDANVKDERQNDWQQGKTRVIVATNAFGMGIDKPDVRLVVHIDCPDSIEAYFQEAGRAGRDGFKAYAVLLYNDADERKLQKRIADTFPEKEYIREIYEHIAYFYQVSTGSGYNQTFEFNIDKFCHNFHHFPIQVDAALRILTRAGYLEYTEEQDYKARVMFTVSRNDLYRLKDMSAEEERLVTALLRNYGGLFTDYGIIDEGLLAQQTGMQPHQLYMVLKGLSHRNLINFIPQKRTPFIRYKQRREDKEHIRLSPEVYEERRRQYEERILSMIAYVKNNTECRSRQLLRYFGEKNAGNCRQCDVCLNQKGTTANNDRLAASKEAILQLLANRQPHPITALRDIQLPTEDVDAALAYLMQEEYIRQEDGMIVRT